MQYIEVIPNCPECDSSDRTKKERVYAINRRLIFYECNCCGTHYRKSNGRVIKMRSKKNG